MDSEEECALSYPTTPHFLPLPPISETSDHPGKQGKIIGTLDVLLARWTALDVSELRQPENRRQGSMQQKHRPTTRPGRPAAADSAYRAQLGFRKAPRETPRVRWTGLAAAVPDTPMSPAALDSSDDAPITQPIDWRSEPVVLQPDSGNRNDADRRGWKGRIASRQSAIRDEDLYEERSEKGSQSGEESTDEGDAASSIPSTGSHISRDSRQSIRSPPSSEDEAVDNPVIPETVQATDSASRLRPRRSVSIKEDEIRHPLFPKPRHRALPHRRQPYGVPPNDPSSYGLRGYTPPFSPVGYGPQPSIKPTFTPYAPPPNRSFSYIDPTIPEPSQGPYTGFYPYPVSPPAPAPAYPAPTGNGVHDDGDVDTLAKKVEALEKLLRESEATSRAQVEQPPLKHEARGTERVTEEQEEVVVVHDAKEKKEAELRATEKAELRAEEEAELRAKEEAEKRNLRLEDAIGRKWVFPYGRCQRWVDVKSLIEQAFAQVEPVELAEHVQQGRFNLVDPCGALILPSLWDTVVQPGWTVTMLMWPTSQNAEAQSEVPPAPARAPGSGPLPSKLVPPAVAMAPSFVLEARSRNLGKDSTIVETGNRASGGENDSITEPIPTSRSNDHGNYKSTYQEALAESLTRHGQQFEETWEALMARSRAKAQRTILEMWLSESEAELRELDPSPSREPSTRGPCPPATRRSAHTSESGNNKDSIHGPGNQTPNDLARQDDVHLGGQKQPPPPATSHIRDPTRCQSCQSPLFVKRPPQQTPMLNRTGSFRSLVEETGRLSPTHLRLPVTLEQRIEMLEDLITRQGADRSARGEKAKGVENEQRLRRLEKVVVDNGVQTPPLTPTRSEPYPMLPTDSVPRRPTPARPGSRPASDGSRSSFRRRLFRRSGPDSAAVT